MAVAVAGLVAVAALQYVRVSDVLQDRVVDTELPAILTGIRNGIEADLAPAVATSQSIVETPAIQRWLQAGEPEDGVAGVAEQLGA